MTNSVRARLLEPSRERLNAAVWDDVKRTAPASQGVPRAIRNLANFLSTERPEIACMIMTAPNINSISAPLRKLVVFEVIVIERDGMKFRKLVITRTSGNLYKTLQDLNISKKSA